MNVLITHPEMKVSVVPSENNFSWLGSSKMLLDSSEDQFLSYAVRKNSRARQIASRKAQSLLN